MTRERKLIRIAFLLRAPSLSRLLRQGSDVDCPLNSRRVRHFSRPLREVGILGVVALVAALPLWIVAAERPANLNGQPKSIASSAASDQGALFTALVPVLRHPRCMNCHSQGDFPRQGDDGHAHTMNVRRGPDGHGITAEKCSTCHQDHNLAGAHLPPGAPSWALPPARTPMIWQGLTDAQLCESIKDRKQNRNRTLDQLVEHLTEDRLVSWAWNPGEGRNPIPMPHDEFAAKVKQWQAAGAPCPAEVK